MARPRPPLRAVICGPGPQTGAGAAGPEGPWAGPAAVRGFGTKGNPHSATYLRTFKRGEYVDIKVDSSVHKGMPFKFYHGRTGVIFNVNKRAVGVTVNKEVNGRIVRKQIHVSLPHVHKSACRNEIISRKKANDEYKKAVKEGKAERRSLKRLPGQPKSGYFFDVAETPETIQPLAYVDLV